LIPQDVVDGLVSELEQLSREINQAIDFQKRRAKDE
jgi:hypothetical protein